MITFIEFTDAVTGAPIYLNMDAIEAFVTLEDGATRINIKGSEGGYHVKESIEKIERLLTR